jgi:hypothetical protein
LFLVFFLLSSRKIMISYLDLRLTLFPHISLQVRRIPLFVVCFSIVRGSFQKFSTLCVFSLKMNLFYKIHLQAFNVISIVLYHSGPAFGQVLYSCLYAFVVDMSDYSGHLIRNLLNASEAFPTEWFLQFWEQVKVWCAQPTRL